jgi:hypothetical protein
MGLTGMEQRERKGRDGIYGGHIEGCRRDGEADFKSAWSSSGSALLTSGRYY